MRSLALSDLNRRPGEVVDMALAAPVTLTKHGRRAVVIMSAEAYDSLVSGRAVVQVTTSEPAMPKKDGPSFLARQGRKVSSDEDENRGE
ncbi:type II toxin-antitoxin system prevent-host-death family antitoxin [Devosia sp. ZW T5_3]|uniref:type II toxin-antitoxin system prevent-host-death family antitoxin n=1 Tax=Devosia sp. ZW T5_3 TaxID=3378085 RepID=UPI003854C63A